MTLSSNQIIEILNHLNIKHAERPNSNGWLLCLCPNPMHNDQHMTNASINLINGVFFCLACGYKKHLSAYVKETLNLDEDQFIEFFKNYNIKIRKKSKLNSQVIEEPKQKKLTEKSGKDIEFSDVLTVLAPDKYAYTNARGFTDAFCIRYGIQRALSGFYSDYMIIPVQDSEKGINTFEARKLMEFEYLKRLYEVDVAHLRLKSKFVSDIATYSIKYKKGILIGDVPLIFEGKSEIIKYLLKSKVFYAPHSNVNQTIWNRENLDYNQDLWITEGLGSVPKIYTGITDNVSCTFGSNIRESQIEILKKFNQKIIVLCDFDEAAYKMIEKLNAAKLNVWVSMCSIKDTDKQFLEKLKNCEIVEANRFLLRLL